MEKLTVSPFPGVTATTLGKDAGDGKVGLANKPRFIKIREQFIKVFGEPINPAHVVVPNITKLSEKIDWSVPDTKVPVGDKPRMYCYVPVGGGAVIPKSWYGYIAPADCPVILMKYQDTLLLLHGSLGELIDMEYIHGHKKTERTGIVVQALHYITSRYGRDALARVQLYSFLSISPSGYTFPRKSHVHASKNVRLSYYLEHMHPGSISIDDRVDLYALIGDIATLWQVRPWNIKEERRHFTDKTDWLYSHRQGDTKRNTVIIHHGP